MVTAAYAALWQASGVELGEKVDNAFDTTVRGA